MIKRIDLFLPPVALKSGMPQLTEALHKAFQRQGISCRLLNAEKNNPEPFLKAIFNDPPDCTFSVNGLLPDDEGRFFCDLVHIPHVACLVDPSPKPYLSLVNSPLNIITCPDMQMCDFFRGLNFQKVLFFPHGVEAGLAPDPALNKIYEAVFIGSCIDYEAQRQGWGERFSPAIAKVLDQAQEIALHDANISLVEALVNAINKTSVAELGTFDVLELLDELDQFILGRNTIDLIRSLKSVKVHVFGYGVWDKYLSKQSNVSLHAAVSKEHSYEIMKQAKIFLNSSPIRNGGHECAFAAMACGALTVTNENGYLKHYFQDDEDLILYRHHDLHHLDDKLKIYMANEAKRHLIADRGRLKVMNAHTWDHRVQKLLQQLDPLLSEMKNRL